MEGFDASVRSSAHAGRRLISRPDILPNGVTSRRLGPLPTCDCRSTMRPSIHWSVVHRCTLCSAGGALSSRRLETWKLHATYGSVDRACVPPAQDMDTELTMRGLTDQKQAELAASLAEPFQQPGLSGQQQPRPEGPAVGGTLEPGSAEDPSAHSSDRSFELNPQRFDPDSGSSPDPSLHAGPARGGPVKHDSPSEVSRDELALHVDPGLQGSLRATL